MKSKLPNTSKQSKRLQALSSVVESLFTDKSSKFLEIYFLFQLRQSWRKMVGEAIFQKAKPVKFKNHVLFLRLPDSTCVQEIHFVKEELKDKINRHFSEYKVEKIIFQT